MMMVWVFWYYNQKTFWIFNLNVRHLSYSCLSLLKHLGLLKAFKGLFLICLSTNWRICENRWGQRQRRCYPLDVILDIWILKNDMWMERFRFISYINADKQHRPENILLPWGQVARCWPCSKTWTILTLRRLQEKVFSGPCYLLKHVCTYLGKKHLAQSRDRS